MRSDTEPAVASTGDRSRMAVKGGSLASALVPACHDSNTTEKPWEATSRTTVRALAHRRQPRRQGQWW